MLVHCRDNMAVGVEVIPIELCPTRRLTTIIGSPLPRAAVMELWRTSSSLILSSPAFP